MATGIAATPTCESPLTDLSAEGLKFGGVPASDVVAAVVDQYQQLAPQSPQ